VTAPSAEAAGQGDTGPEEAADDSLRRFAVIWGRAIFPVTATSMNRTEFEDHLVPLARILRDALRRGVLTHGRTILDATSGNNGSEWLALLSSGAGGSAQLSVLGSLDQGPYTANYNATNGNGNNQGLQKLLFVPAALKVTDANTKSDTVPYSAYDPVDPSAKPAQNSELCLRADPSSEKAVIEIDLPKITDASVRSKFRWKVVEVSSGAVVKEGVFDAAAASADPSTNVNDTTRSTGIPISAAVSGLCDTARIAVPSFV